MKLTVTSVEQPSFHSVDTCEDKWLSTLNTQINIQSIFLPQCEIILLSCLLTYFDLFTTSELAVLKLPSQCSAFNF